MRKAVPLIFAVAVAAADPALACKELAKDQASAAAYLLQQQSYVVKRCVTCPEERREMVKVASVAVSPAPAQRWTVTLNGAPVDIEEVYLPQKIHHVNPEYPALARQARVQGKVVLDVVVDKDGNVTDFRVVESPHPMLDEAAILAVQQWRYKPILIDGVPTRARVRVTTTFGLK